MHKYSTSELQENILCGRYTIRSRMAEVAAYFEASVKPLTQLALRFNAAPSQDMGVVKLNNSMRELAAMKWGLIPSWADDPKIGWKMSNARSETVKEKASFRTAFKKRRCLIPADGFYEWKREGKAKQPYLFSMKDDGLFAFAGLWEPWNDLETFTILTTSANELMAPIHDRMPVILAKGDYDTWLDTSNDDVEYLFEPYPSNQLKAVPVDPMINNARNEGAEFLRPMNSL